MSGILRIHMISSFIKHKKRIFSKIAIVRDKITKKIISLVIFYYIIKL